MRTRLNKKYIAKFLLFWLVVVIQPSIADDDYENEPLKVKVMTQNLYVGADLFRILNASSPAEIPLLAAETLEIIINTNFYERAEAIAEQIKEEKPDLIGLQEVSLIRTQTPSDYFIGNPEQAKDPLYDYLEILLYALEEKGLHYSVAGIVQNIDIEVPAVAGIDESGVPQFIDVRLTDRDVILAKTKIETSNLLSGNYQTNIQLLLGGSVIELTRGYVAVDAEVHEKSFRFVNTHLEVNGDWPISAVQALQAQELIGILVNETKPVILVGDFNSAPVDDIDPITGVVPPYLQLGGSGYTDVWLLRKGKPKPGFTCCQAEALDNVISSLDQRIDYIFFRPDPVRNILPDLLKIKSDIVGDELEDKTESGLWPSDHAGVYAKIKVRMDLEIDEDL